MGLLQQMRYLLCNLQGSTKKDRTAYGALPRPLVDVVYGTHAAEGSLSLGLRFHGRGLSNEMVAGLVNGGLRVYSTMVLYCKLRTED